MRRVIVTGIVLLASLLAGCSTQPTATPLPPAPTQAPSATARPTSTAVPTPSATATARPTSTATPSPTATPDYLANPPARPASPARTTHWKQYPAGAYEFIHAQFDVPPPAGRVPDEYVASLPAVEPGLCPLTGEQPEREENLAYRPVNIRVDNSSESRPQTGLGRADVVWETTAEAGITRFTATYQCRQPETAGPVRSARLIDLQLTPMLGALLVHVGAAQPVTDLIWSSPFADYDIDEWAGDAAFYRVDQAPRGWLRTYTDGGRLARVAEERGVRRSDAPLRGWRFSAEVPSGAAGPATRVTIPYGRGGASAVTYRYDPDRRLYLRFQSETPHLDRATGQQLAAANVLVLFAPETVTLIVEDKYGNRSLHYDLIGEGRGLLFRDGQVWDATWRREGENTLVRIVDRAGDPIPLKPGQSWVQIVPDTMDVTWE